MLINGHWRLGLDAAPGLCRQMPGGPVGGRRPGWRPAPPQESGPKPELGGGQHVRPGCAVGLRTPGPVLSTTQNPGGTSRGEKVGLRTPMSSDTRSCHPSKGTVAPPVLSGQPRVQCWGELSPDVTRSGHSGILPGKAWSLAHCLSVAGPRPRPPRPLCPQQCPPP